MLYKLRSNDLLVEKVYGVCSKFFKEIPSTFLSEYNVLIDIDLHENGRINGFIFWKDTYNCSPFNSSNNDIVYISFLGVHEDCRKMGIGKKLLNYLNTIYQYKRLQLDVSVKNIPAIKLYEKMGFHKTKLIQQYYPDEKEGLYSGDGCDAFIMTTLHKIL